MMIYVEQTKLESTGNKSKKHPLVPDIPVLNRTCITICKLQLRDCLEIVLQFCRRKNKLIIHSSIEANRKDHLALQQTTSIEQDLHLRSSRSPSVARQRLSWRTRTLATDLSSRSREPRRRVASGASSSVRLAAEARAS